MLIGRVELNPSQVKLARVQIRSTMLSWFKANPYKANLGRDLVKPGK